MKPIPVLAILRRATWRRFGAALALAALLVQGLIVTLHLQAHAAAVPWDEAAAICHGGGDAASSPAGPSGDDSDSDHSGPACPLCLALQQAGKALPPADAFILLPPPPPHLAIAPPQHHALAARAHRPQLPRGPPISG